MKIDFDLLEKMVTAGASGAVILAFLREQHDRKAPRRAADAKRKSAERKRTRADTVRISADDEANLADTPRARLFREGKAILASIGVNERRAGGLLAQWLKLTNDDDNLVMAAIVGAQNKVTPDPPGYILATLRGKMNERSGSNTGSDQSRSTAIIAGVAAAAQRRFGGGGQGSVSAATGPAREDDPQLI